MRTHDELKVSEVFVKQIERRQNSLAKTAWKIRRLARKLFAVSVANLYFFWSVLAIHAYSFNEIVPDVREPANLSGGSACPVPARQWIAPGSNAVEWSTILGSSPQTILTSSQAPVAITSEIQAVIQQAENVWTGVTATSLASNTFTIPAQVATANICGADGVNSICFDQEDMGFTPGVLAFTRIISADAINIQLGNVVSTQVGQILDADIYFNPGDTSVTFATPSALAANPTSYDLESLLVHELGHLLGFGHSAVFTAIMFPFAAAPGTFSGERPTAQQPDAPLGDDDRAGLRTLYPNPTDTTYIGSIQGRVLPANPLSLPTAPTGDRNLRRARGSCERIYWRCGRGHPRRLELHLPEAGSIRRNLPYPASACRQQLQHLCRATQRSRHTFHHEHGPDVV
jgi:Matrixin